MSASLSGASERSGTAAKAPGRGQLGKNAKSATPPDRRKIKAARAERYQLLSAARALFLHQGKKAGLLHPANFHRTAKCKHTTHGMDIGVHVSQEHGAGFFSGLVTCGSVWACPVCAAKVQERRREEIAQAIDWAYEQGLQPVMVTLTFPHYAWQNLGDLIAQQADALRRMRAGAPWKRFRVAHGYRGLIRALELTHGAHGWHPHTHELWFVSADVAADLSTDEKREIEASVRARKELDPLPDDAVDMRSKILDRWRSSCAKAGLLDLANAAQVAAFDAHSVDVKGWCSASDYLAKHDESRHWGADREIAKASTKAGRAKGLHPFGLLANAAEGDRAAGGKYLEYTEAMKGKAQLFWSRGLKDEVGITDVSDEELAEQERDSADLLGRLSLLQWRRVRDADQRCELLEAAESGGWPAVLVFLANLQKKPPPKRQGPRLIGA